MTTIKTLLTLLVLSLSAFSAHAKIWRVNNNAGVVTDFTTFNLAVISPLVLAGDTLHIEASATSYGGATFTKRLVVIGVGYFLDPANTTTPGNSGFQANTFISDLSNFNIGDGANGSKFLGVTMGVTVSSGATPINLTFEKCYMTFINFSNATHSGITIRKCFFNNAAISGTTGSLTNFVCENNIFWSTFGYFNLPILTGTSNILRNNSFKDVGAGPVIANCYIANNIFGVSPQISFTNCTIKNNLFTTNQTLPVTATNNLVNVVVANIYVGGTTGSLDSRMALKAGSPAIAAGLTVGAVVTPDCGAYGATDPYKLSGIPNIPSIYALTVPVSIPAGTTSMSATLSTKNHN